jgi:hypothetical protein
MTSGINRILETESPAAGVENTYPFISYPLTIIDRLVKSPIAGYCEERSDEAIP